MRKRARAGIAICVLLAAAPAACAAAFQLYGGMGDGQARRNPSHEALLHKTRAFASNHDPGTIVIRTGERRLYYILSNSEAIEYIVGVGREGFTWTGTNRVTRMAEWPYWRPPKEMIEREARHGRDIPGFMAGGPGNPLGARAIYIGDTEFRIHGTTQPWTVGLAVSSGCVRLMNEEVIDLYNRVEIGALVVVE